MEQFTKRILEQLAEEYLNLEFFLRVGFLNSEKLFESYTNNSNFILDLNSEYFLKEHEDFLKEKEDFFMVSDFKETVASFLEHCEIVTKKADKEQNDVQKYIIFCNFVKGWLDMITSIPVIKTNEEYYVFDVSEHEKLIDTLINKNSIF